MKRISAAFAACTALLTSCSPPGFLLEEVTRQEVFQVDISGIPQEFTEPAENDVYTLDMRLGCGNITIDAAESDTAKITVTYTARAVTEKQARELIDRVEPCIVYNENTLSIEFFERNTGREFWDWLAHDHLGMSLSAEVFASIPQNINDIHIQSDTGAIVLSKTNAVYDVHTDTGNVELRSAGVYKSADISSDTGNVSIETDKPLAEGTAVTLTTDTGNVRLTAGAEINSADVTLKTDTGSIGLVLPDKLTSSSFSLTTDTGSINIS